jgi:thiosulfate dehydrogenase [quinone] large subunit
MRSKTSFSHAQLIGLVLLRVLVGWYFLYEGVSKLLAPNWSAYGYLMDSKGFMAPFFTSLADSPIALSVINFLNVYGLLLVGLSLMLGVFSRLGSVGAILMLLLFYLSHPPLLDVSYVLRPEGSYLWVDKNTIIMLSVVVSGLLFPTSHRLGIDRFIHRKRK